ncbi:MAG: YeeE/YedE thiosulfate transporter family protein [Kiritimatiellae bacterium]|nr:YeeE/YedE thiosulfate transporter family protein [Kiritimatiellia bacterium]
MFTRVHNNKRLQLTLGLLFGFCFGFLLQKGRVCDYEIIMRQLLLQDFTVLKIMLTAMATGMLGVYAMRGLGWVKLHKKAGSLGANIPGPLIFGIGFGMLGYCPGTSVGAVAHGALDALVGVIGILIGAGLYAAVYPKIKGRILAFGDFGGKTLIDVLPVRNPWAVILPLVAVIALLLFALEKAGL